MILDGKIVAGDIKQRLKEEIDEAVAEGKRPPRLVIISVGEDPASKVYVRNKIKAAEEVGIMTRHYCFAADDEPEAVLELIGILNDAYVVDGIMIQLPLPEGWDERAIIDTIDSSKDVDGLTTTNIGRLRSGQECLKPCTAAGIIDLCKYYDIDLDGKDVTIIGRSNIVGKPLADMMMAEGATVTQCHSHTHNLDFHIQGADIVVSAIGKPEYFGQSTFKGWHDAVIDVGINRTESGRLCGDIKFNEVQNLCGGITPVPGGVGPMTVAELMSNTVEAWRNNIKGS
jgi:methylenetetrahydrofolate dehydrogenase (NADP+)/methenyltetrahydrofolate cyclohydrolase